MFHKLKRGNFSNLKQKIWQSKMEKIYDNNTESENKWNAHNEVQSYGICTYICLYMMYMMDVYKHINKHDAYL